jgi:hypothetical protein
MSEESDKGKEQAAETRAEEGAAMSEDSRRAAEQATWTPALDRLLQDWRKRVYAAQTAYYEIGERFRHLNYLLGIPVVIVSSLVGTAIFADISKVDSHRWLIGSVSIVAGILSSLQTFLKFGENATLHGAAGDWFAAIRRDIEQLLALPAEMRGSPKECLDSIRQEMNKAGQKAPELGERLWKRYARRFGIEEVPRKAKRRTDGGDREH